MSTFLNDMVNKGYTKKEDLDVLFKSEEEKERRRVSAIVTKAIYAIRLENVRELLAYQQLAIWRRVNGFDRVANVEKKWFGGHRSLSLTPERYTSSLWSEVDALKEAISMPAEDTVTRPRQKDSLDAKMKRYKERRSREAARAQVTAVTRDDTVQHCSPTSQTPEPPSDAYVKLENNEGKMGQELGELKSSSAGTGLETPEQQCPPTEGIWETGKTTVSGILTAGAGPSRGENISSPAERATGTVTVADISSIAATPSKRRHKTFSEENKQFDPGEQGEKARLGTRLYSTFFSGESGQASCCFLFVPRALCFLCVCFPNLFFLLHLKLTSEAAGPGRGSGR